MRTRLTDVTLRRPSGRTLLATFMLIGAVLVGGAALAQIAVPKYQSPLEAPRPQTPSLPAPTPVTPDATVVEYPIVRVNDQIIDSSDYQRGQRDMLEEEARNNATPAEVQQRQKDLLRDMIDQQLLISRGKELDINADSEVIRRLDDIRKQNHFDTMEDLEKAVRQSGISYEDFKANIKNSIVTQEVVRDEVGRKLALSTKQEQAYYDQHKQEFEQPEQVRLSEILVPTSEDATDPQIAKAQAKAAQVVAQLKSGAKFEDLAKQFSGGQTADKGGDLGDFKRGALAKVLEDQTFTLKPGEFTAPIRTKQGFVVLEVTEHTAPGIPPLSAIEPQVQEAIYQAAIQPALRTYLTSLREKAFIYIEPGFVDTGASGKETKSVFVGATAPPEKKKAAQKARLERNRTAAAATLQATTAATPALTGTSTAPSAAANLAPAKAVRVSKSGKPKKVKREKIRFGQAPQNALPPAPEETLRAGTDQGSGATSSVLPAPGAAIASPSEVASTSSDEDPLTPKAVVTGKTRYSDRAPTEAKAKAAVKVAKAKQKIAATPVAMTTDEKTVQQLQRSPLEPGGDTGKKKKKVKGAPKERIQEKAPTPPTPRPDATPIPPKSVRDNGEPVVTPSPNPSTLPPVTAPAPGAPVDMQPSTPEKPAPAVVPPQ